jgi:hypothetical protein
MATLTATAATSTAPVRRKNGVNSVTVSFNDATAISISATTVLMCKVPHGATILDVYGKVSAGSATCPFTIGIQGDLSAFATGGVLGNVVLRATKGIPYDVSVSGDTATQFMYVNMTMTPSSVTSEVEPTLTVIYTTDK